MKRLLVAACCLCSAAVFAAESAAPSTAAPSMKDAATQTNVGFHPHMAKNAAQAKKDLEALMKSDDDNMKTGNVEAMATNVDFPVYMITDSSKDEGMGEAWSHDQFVKTMTAAMAGMPKEAKTSHKSTFNVLTDSLAVVNCDMTMSMHGKNNTWKSSSIAIKKNGKWMWKSMMEGGWGDMPSMATGTGASGNAGMTGSTTTTNTTTQTQHTAPGTTQTH